MEKMTENERMGALLRSAGISVDALPITQPEFNAQVHGTRLSTAEREELFELLSDAGMMEPAA